MRSSLAAKGRLLVAAALWAAVAVSGQEITRTQISDTLFNADGSRAEGSLRISWKSFTAADGATVAKNSVDMDIVDGIVSVGLAPNLGAVPEGTYYSVEYRLRKGERSNELWIVPDSAEPVSIADIRVLSVPAAGMSVSLAQVNGLSAALDAKADKAATNTFLAPQVLREDAPGTSNPVLGLQKNDGAAGVFFRLPELPGDITYTLPPNAGSPNQSLTTDGSGVLSWSSAGGGGSGDAISVNASAVDTTANLHDTTTIAWTLADGGAGGPDDVQASVAANSIGPEQIDETATYDFSGGGMTLPSGVAIGSGSTPFNLTGYTDDAAPSAPGAANQFTMYVDRSSGLLSWILNGGSEQAALTVGAQNAGTNITADLEEETHASEHAENAADELLIENLGTACAAGETGVSNGSGGLTCTAVGEGGGGGGASFDPHQQTEPFWRDDFVSRSDSGAGDDGELGWMMLQSGTGNGVSTPQPPEDNHPGILRVTSGTTDDAYRLYQFTRSQNDEQFANFDGSTFDSHWLVRQDSCSDVAINIGFRPSGANAPSPTTGIYVRFDTDASDTNYIFLVGDGTTQANDTGVACSTGWHDFRIYSTSAGTVALDIDEVNVATEATNVPTAGLTPVFQVASRSTTSKNLDIDIFTLSFDVTRPISGSGGGSGVEELTDLSDVGDATPTNGNALMADGDSWESRPLVEADISDFGTYLTASPFGASIDDTELTAEDFGDFTNAGGEDGFTLDADSVSANELNAGGVEAELEAVLDLADLQGAVTDGQVPNTITIDLATTATTANAGDSATSFFSTGTLEDARLSANVSLLGQEIGGAELVAEDFGDFTCDGNAAGCSLDADSVSANELADAYQTRKITFQFEDPVTGDSGRFQAEVPSAATLLEVACNVEAATSVTIDLFERARATPGTGTTGMLTTPLACDTDGAVTTSFTDSALAGDVPLALGITAVSGTPGLVRVHVKYRLN